MYAARNATSTDRFRRCHEKQRRNLSILCAKDLMRSRAGAWSPKQGAPAHAKQPAPCVLPTAHAATVKTESSLGRVYRQVFDAIGENSKHESFDFGYGLRTTRPIGQGTRKSRHFGNPAPVIFYLCLYSHVIPLALTHPKRKPGICRMQLSLFGGHLRAPGVPGREPSSSVRSAQPNGLI